MEQDVRDETTGLGDSPGPNTPSAQGDGHPGNATAAPHGDPGVETPEQAELAQPAETLSEA